MTDEEMESFNLWLKNRGRSDLCHDGTDRMPFASHVAILVKRGRSAKQIGELCDLWEQWKKEWVDSL